MKLLPTHQAARWHNPKVTIRILTVVKFWDVTSRSCLIFLFLTTRIFSFAHAGISEETALHVRPHWHFQRYWEWLPLFAATEVGLGTSARYKRPDITRKYVKICAFVSRKVTLERTKASASKRCYIKSAHFTATEDQDIKSGADECTGYCCVECLVPSLPYKTDTLIASLVVSLP